LGLRPQQLWVVALRARSSRESVRQPAPFGALEIGKSAQQAGLDLVLNQLLASTVWLTIRSKAGRGLATD